jgi:hypothetical protein
VDGLLLKFTQHETSFWMLFGSIRQDLDRLYWVFGWPPWMGAPDDFTEGDRLWRPGTLSRFADRFCEEEIKLWGIEPTRDDPRALADLEAGDDTPLIREYAEVWLRYSNCPYWEIFARKADLLECLEADLVNKPWIEVFPTRDDQPEIAYRQAGWNC